MAVAFIGKGIGTSAIVSVITGWVVWKGPGLFNESHTISLWEKVVNGNTEENKRAWALFNQGWVKKLG